MAAKSSHQVSQHHSLEKPAISRAEMIEIALYQPDIAQNAGTIARLCACFVLPLTIIEPAGFAWDNASFRRAGMDYLDMALIKRAASWSAFRESSKNRRIILLTTKGTNSYLEFRYEPGDILLLGRESAGVPQDVHDAASARIIIPMMPPARSLNVALATAMVTGEALRQVNFSG
jgi:tRNA (cytidine/uridine-2'-O-)-methyltransferase